MNLKERRSRKCFLNFSAGQWIGKGLIMLIRPSRMAGPVPQALRAFSVLAAGLPCKGVAALRPIIRSSHSRLASPAVTHTCPQQAPLLFLWQTSKLAERRAETRKDRPACVQVGCRLCRVPTVARGPCVQRCGVRLGLAGDPILPKLLSFEHVRSRIPRC
jgi:hypothetical protein